MNDKDETQVAALDSAAVRLENVKFGFGPIIIHKNISFSAKQGEVLTILGPSGVGKTLILKMIVGLLRPIAGSVQVLGTPLEKLPEKELRSIRRNIGMLFQGAALFDSLSVFENVAYSLREFGETDEDKIAAIVNEKLSIIGLPTVGSKAPSQLSGGQKKRVGLARALVNSPKVVLFDEPTTGLDPTAIRLIDDLIIQLRDEFNITCIVVTHDIESARRISDRWLLIDNGRVAADGPVAEVSTGNKYIIDFVSGNWRSELQCL